MASEASQNVMKLTGHDKVFNIHFIGELKIRNTNHNTRKARMTFGIEFEISSQNLITIPIMVSDFQFIQLKKYNRAQFTMMFTIKPLIIFMIY